MQLKLPRADRVNWARRCFVRPSNIQISRDRTMAALDIPAQLTNELNEATQRARKLVETTDGRVFTVRPHPNSWSAAECLAHLTLTDKAFLPVIQDAIAKARKSRKKSPHLDPLGSAMRWFMEPPVRLRSTTAPPFVPRAA